MSIRSFLTRLIWLCVLPLGILAAYLAVDKVSLLRFELDQESGYLAQNYAKVLDQQLKSRIDALQVLSASPLVDDPSRWSDLYREAQGFQQRFGSHVLLADRSKRMLFNTRVPFGTALPDLPQVKGQAAAPTALATGKPAVGDRFFGPVAKVPLVAVAVPVIRGGQVPYLLLTVMEAAQFQKRLDEVALPPGWTLAVVDGKGEVIVRRPSLAAETEARGEDTQGRFVVASEVSPWSVVLEVPLHLYRAPVYQAAAVLGGAILVASLVSLLGGGLAGRRLGRAVASLAEPSPPDGDNPAIAEIETVRRLLAQAAADRETAEATRREGERRYRQLFDVAPVPLCLANQAGGIMCNGRFVEVFGYSLEEVPTAEEWWQRAYPEAAYRRQAIEAWEAAVRKAEAVGGDIEPSEYRVTCKNRQVRTMEISGIIIGSDLLITFFDVTGRKQAEDELRRSNLAALNLMEDAILARNRAEASQNQLLREAEERRQAEEALRVSERRLRRAEAVAHLGHWRVDLATDRVSWSEEVYHIFGLDRETYRPSREAYAGPLHPDDLEVATRAQETILRDGEASFAFRAVRPDAEVRHVAGYGELVRNEAGEVVAMFGTLQDTTELRRQERELQEKNAELERFTYTVSHDLKSPLVTIKAFLGYLEKDLEHETAEQVGKDLHYLRTAADKMGRLLDELLEMSRLGRVSNPPERVLYRDLVDEALNLVAGSIAEKGVEVLVGEETLTLVGDRPRLVEIWQNLVENAVKFMGEQPSPRLEIGVESQGREVIFFVRDNGQGVDPRYQEKIFGLFEKLDPGSEGTGLGLALVKRIVELHEGRIWVESAGPGQGACFRFTLPGAVREKAKGEMR